MNNQKQTVRFYDPVEETLAKLYRMGSLHKPEDLPPHSARSFFMTPSGDYLSTEEHHQQVMERLITKRLRFPNGTLRPLGREQQEGFYKDLNIIKIGYEAGSNNRLDFVFFVTNNPRTSKSNLHDL